MRVTTFYETTAPRGTVFFFAGWGMNERPFAAWADVWRAHAADVNLFFISHYGQGELAPGSLAKIMAEGPAFAVVGWSFGVRAALSVLNELSESALARCRGMTAVNGTFLPVSRHDGIAPAIAGKTLAALSKESLESFYKNMTLENRSSFTEPNRTIESLSEELRFLLETSPETLSEIDRKTMRALHIEAVVSLKDRIIPARCQKHFWEAARAEGVDVAMKESHTAHWDGPLLQEVLINATAHL